MEPGTVSKDKVIFLDKKELKKPLSSHSKYIEELAENDPNNPGNEYKYLSVVKNLIRRYLTNRPNNTISGQTYLNWD